MWNISGQSKDSGNIRVTFHPNIEVPKLKAWYQEHPFPSDNLLSTYVTELNTSLVRLERPKVEIKHLKQWWINQKQKLKREERSKSLDSLNGAGNGEENCKQSKKRVKVLSQKSKSEKKLLNNQKRENEVREIEGEGVVCEVNIFESLPGRSTDEIKSNVRKTVLGNNTRNTTRDVSFTGNPENSLNHQSLFTSPVCQAVPMNASNDIDQSHHLQFSSRSLDSDRGLEKGASYQYLGGSVNVRGINLHGDSHYQPL